MPYKDPEKRRAYSRVYGRAYREAHHEEMAARRSSEREKKCAYDAEHYRRPGRREYELEYMKSYYKAHREERKVYNADHRSERHACFQAWSKNPRAMAAHAARESRRRAQKKGSIIIGDEAAVRKIYERAASLKPVRCYLCGKLIPKGHRHIDHIIPLSKGGVHRASNLAVTCDTCNECKGAKMLEEIGLLL